MFWIWLVVSLVVSGAWFLGYRGGYRRGHERGFDLCLVLEMQSPNWGQRGGAPIIPNDLIRDYYRAKITEAEEQETSHDE